MQIKKLRIHSTQNYKKTNLINKIHFLKLLIIQLVFQKYKIR